MLVGHFAVGLSAKRIEPTISLGTLVLASMIADFLGCIFTIAGIEHVQSSLASRRQNTSAPQTLPRATVC
jgi:hypothetical protein